MAEKSSSDALEAFLDSAPDPFRARPPTSTKVSTIHPSVPYKYLCLRCCKGLTGLVQLHHAMPSHGLYMLCIALQGACTVNAPLALSRQCFKALLDIVLRHGTVWCCRRRQAIWAGRIAEQRASTASMAWTLRALLPLGRKLMQRMRKVSWRLVRQMGWTSRAAMARQGDTCQLQSGRH